MDIIKFAMQMEQDGQKFYKEAADKAPTKELKDILTYLAEEELRHFKIFSKMREGAGQETIKGLGSQSLETTKNLFIQLAESGEGSKFGDDTRAVWVKALKIEEQAVKMYSEEADKEGDSNRKGLLNRISDEERTHVYLIDNVLAYMTDPETFKDSKQFADFKSWEGR